jgi:MFS transporter, DHA1 family, multidrug resistance protein
VHILHLLISPGIDPIRCTCCTHSPTRVALGDPCNTPIMDIMREAPFGQLIRLLSGNRYFKYPEEEMSFVRPHSYEENAAKESLPQYGSPVAHDDGFSAPAADAHDKEKNAAGPQPLQQQPQTRTLTPEREREHEPVSSSSDDDVETAPDYFAPQPGSELQRRRTLPYTLERLETERQLGLERMMSRPILPMRMSDSTILVDWYTTDDPANPQNWSQKKKAFVALQIE